MPTTTTIRQKMMHRSVLAAIVLAIACLTAPLAQAASTGTIAQKPLFLTKPVAPISMIDLPKDQSLFRPAYNDFSDLDGDGEMDTTYKNTINYTGYFDYGICYVYKSGQFVPDTHATNHYCNGQAWSGNFLNWVTMSRMDIVRLILFGGKRVTDSSTKTVLQRAYIPTDAHSWAKYYSNDNHDANQLTPFTDITTTHTQNTDGTTQTCNAYGNCTTDTIDLQYAVNHPGNQSAPTGICWNGKKCSFYVANHTNLPTGTSVKVYPKGTTPSSSSDYATATVLKGTYSTWGGYAVNIQFSSVPSGLKSDQWTIQAIIAGGISFCNTTYGKGLSQDNQNPPIMAVAKGNYALWASNGGTQCHWLGATSFKNHTNKNNLEVNQTGPGSNGNEYAITGMLASADNPSKDQAGLGEAEYHVDVVACVSGLIAGAQCTKYPDGNYKPTGLLQKYGDDGSIKFGLFTGSYNKNFSGGVLRANARSMADEIHTNSDGRFRDTQGIISNLNNIRIYDFKNNDMRAGNHYGDDSCGWSKKRALADSKNGTCRSWGNPFSEIYLESLRYLAGKKPTSAFNTTPVSGKAITLSIATWKDPLEQKNYCAPLSVLAFNTGTANRDNDEMGGLSDLGATQSAKELTNTIGTDEGISGNTWFVGNTAGDDSDICSAKTITNLGGVFGLCPESPTGKGSYLIAGAAWYAYTHKIRDDITVPTSDQRSLRVKTYGVQLAAGVPRIKVKVGDQTVTILPANRTHYTGGSTTGVGSLVDFRQISKTPTSGKYYINWEDGSAGGDYEQDMWGILSYTVDDSKHLTIKTVVVAQSSQYITGFGFITSGTTQDGVHFISGMNGFDYTDPTGVTGCQNCVTKDVGSYQFTVGSSSAGDLQKPLYYAAKWGGFTDSNGNDTPDKQGEWDANGDGVPDNYFYAVNPLKLKSALDAALSQINAQVGSATALASNSTQISANSRLYQAKFWSKKWYGMLSAYKIDLSDNSVDLNNPVWSVTDKIDNLNWGTRSIYTWVPGSGSTDSTGAEFKWGKLNADQQDTIGQQSVLQWVRGDRSKEGSTYRQRTHLLGDIVNSSPVYVATPDFRNYLLPCPHYTTCPDAASTPSTKYESDFRHDAISGRQSAIYVGANDGMLHAFNADTGAPLFAYVPNAVYPNLDKLASLSYTHRYYVDGTIAFGDAYINTPSNGTRQWHTVLLGTLGGGGKGIFALDVTHPKTFNANDVLWEYDASTQQDKDMGYTFGKPSVVRLNDGYWYAVFNNGYASTSGHAVLYLMPLDANPGAALPSPLKITLDTTCANNGLSSATPVDVDGNRVTDYVYAGDLCGNMWKIDLTKMDEGKTSFVKLFHATDANGKAQPITSRPAVGRNPRGGYMVYFGTGQYIYASDNQIKNSDPRNAFYAIWDKNATVTKSQLVQQKITKVFNGGNARIVTQKSVNYASGKKGWYLNLLNPDTSGGTTTYKYNGERVIAQPILRYGKIIFTTAIPVPASEPCKAGGTGWLMELDALSGGRLNDPTIDINNDGNLNDDDRDSDGNAASGTKSDIGLLSRPTISQNPDNPNKEVKYVGGSTGNIDAITERGHNPAGRISWRQAQ